MSSKGESYQLSGAGSVVVETKQPTGTQISPAEVAERSINIEPVPILARVGSYFPGPCCIANILFGWVEVKPMEVVAVLHLSQLTRLIDTPGCFKTPCFGRTERRVNVSRQTSELPNTKVVDIQGNPIMVSALINYRVKDAKLALFNVGNYHKYVKNNATGVLKTVAGSYAYDDLKRNGAAVNEELARTLQPLVDCAGVEVLSMNLNELNYAPEIASCMLKTQAAAALVEARHIIVQGAVDIAKEAIVQLESDGTLKMAEPDKVKIVSNLLTVTCADSSAVPTLSV
jgi:regulator of protease activity HflC (stomatin/prohibitin superfamily)